MVLLWISFNTSHVVVYPSAKTGGGMVLECFNTSHVVVYPASATPESANMNSFNTSHVVVYQNVKKWHN